METTSANFVRVRVMSRRTRARVNLHDPDLMSRKKPVIIYAFVSVVLLFLSYKLGQLSRLNTVNDGHAVHAEEGEVHMKMVFEISSWISVVRTSLLSMRVT